MNTLRLWIKDTICRLGFGSRLVEYCERCGWRVRLVWWSDDALWSAVTDAKPVKGDNMAGIYCPKCFDAKADERGILVQWRAGYHHTSK